MQSKLRQQLNQIQGQKLIKEVTVKKNNIRIIKKVIWIKGKNNKNHTSWQKNQCPGKIKNRLKGSVLVVLAQNLFSN